jgi:hypothetical protein
MNEQTEKFFSTCIKKYYYFRTHYKKKILLKFK